MNKSALSSFAKSIRFADTLIDSSGELTNLQNTSINGSAEDSPDIPDVNERLAYLKPSRQLLEFYRKKFAEQDCEHVTLVEHVESYRSVVDKQHGIEWDLRQREEEITELQKALSEMQVSLFQEREQILRLYAENDRYKIQDLGSRRVIKKLLEESNHKIEDESTDLRPESRRRGRPARLTKVPKMEGYKLVVDSQIPGEDDRLAREGLHKQIEVMQAKLETQAREYKELIEAGLQQRHRLADEYNYVREKDTDKLKTATEKLHKTQELLYLSTQDLLSLQQESKTQERQWMVQKDKLLRELDSVKEQLNIDQPERCKKVVLNVSADASGDATHRQKQELQRLREEVAHAHNLQEMYREQLVVLEDDLAQLREQDDLKNDDFKDKVSKVGKRHHIMKERFADLEKRRNLEVAGYKSDIKALRKRLKELQQQMFKVTLNRADSMLDDSRPPELDLAVLKNIRTTAKRSTQVHHGLKDMKLRLHNMQQLACR